MFPVAKRFSARPAAFTLAELLVTAGLSVILASIIYTVGSEALVSFARNISINRSYSDARIALDRIAQTVQSSGHTPVLVNSDGLTTAAASPAAGIRFYRYDSTPCYLITAGLVNAKTITITVPSVNDSPQVGDLISIGAIGFQGLVTAVSADKKTLTFANTLASGCVPATAVTSLAPVAATPSTDAVQYSCLAFTQVAFVAVGTQLRYYPRAATSATAFSTAANYKVIANLVASPSNPNQQLPFQLGPAPTINVTICAEGPDYNNRQLGTANTFTQFETCLGSRCPLLLRGPF